MSFLLGANLFLGATLLEINISHQKSLIEDGVPFPKVGYLSSLGGFVKFQGIFILRTSQRVCRSNPKRFQPPVGLAAASMRFEPSQGLGQ